MATFNFKELPSTTTDFFQGKCILWVINADKSPPHVGISMHDSFYSLKVNGKDEDLPCHTLVKLFQTKKKKVLLYEIEVTEALNLRSIFNKYNYIINGKSTCLTPIHKALLNVDNSILLKNLIEQLESQSRIKAIFGLNLNPDFTGIPAYSMAEVLERITQIQDVRG